MREVLSSGKYMPYLSEDGYMQIGGHYVLSVRSEHRHKVGVVTDESRSGRTVYVEPHELVGIARELKELQQELNLTVRRVFGQMCIQVSRASGQLNKCLEAAARITPLSRRGHGGGGARDR